MLLILFWYCDFAGNTRVVNQKELEFFREEMAKHNSSTFNVILKGKNLPMSLLKDYQKVSICFYSY
jgi:hypothetical protein